MVTKHYKLALCVSGIIIWMILLLIIKRCAKGCDGWRAKTETNRTRGSTSPLSSSCYSYTRCIATNTCCHLLSYTSTNLTRCSDVLSTAIGKLDSSRRVSIAILGDSIQRQLFTSFAHLLIDTNMTYDLEGSHGTIRELVPLLLRGMNIHTAIVLRGLDITLDITFYWDPILTDLLPKLLQQWLQHSHTSPHLLIIGTGPHYLARYNDMASVMLYKHWKTVLPSLTTLAKTTHTIVKAMDHTLVKYHKPPFDKILADLNIDNFNSKLSDMMVNNPSIIMWNSTLPLSDQYISRCYEEKLTANDYMWNCDDPLHLGYVVIHQYRNMILNSFCNRYMGLDDTYCL